MKIRGSSKPVESLTCKVSYPIIG